jgi:hypothetical protein
MKMYPISEDLFERLHQWQKTNKSQRFSWALWINNLKQFGGMVGPYLKELDLPLKEEVTYLFDFMTGKFLINRFEKTPFLKYILKFYIIGNDMINSPDNIIKAGQVIDFQEVPRILPSSKQFH